ncbi:phage major capsid protein [Haematobacter missouriensis]|uniref:Phage major capsid protein n=1 Tax=Haematobacter missouriensis TaxID=366616 RepID=A0A212AQT5_9RHOB|nr:phage major capsid protein [Haematobacter missouriensis]OWJ83813.1 phage major capsid protein [Haematobacter missouriensis]
MDRMYSTIAIKAVDEDARIITGIASTPTPDRADDVVIPEGATFKLPIPLLYQHDHSQPIGHVVKAKVTKSGIEIEASIAKGLSDVDAIWSKIKAGLVRGLSIGFRGIEAEEIPRSWGRKFTKWEWLELSAVVVPANAEATILTVKQFAGASSGQTGNIAPSVEGHPKTVSLVPKEGKTMKTYAEQIAALEAKRQANTARMEEVMSKSMTEGRSTDASEQEEFDTLESEIGQIDGDLKRLRSMERLAVSKAVAVEGVKSIETGSNVRGGLAPVTVKAPKLDAGIGFARLAKIKAISKLDGESPRHIAKMLYGEDSAEYGMLVKAAVPAGTTTGATWAGPLVGEQGSAFADFLEYLRPQTILGRFGAAGVPSLRRVPFRVPLIGQTSGGAGYWVGQGKAKPLTKFDFERRVLDPTKVANIAVVTEEVLRDSSPAAEAIVRDSLAAALRERLDIDFVDPAKAAVANVSPQSITNGATAIPSNGTTADDVRADFQALMGAFIAANNAPTTGVWIMSATRALSLSLMRSPLGAPEFPDITMTGGTLFGMPVIVSEYVDADIVILANASDIYLADDGGIAVDMSREASLQMDDAPTMASDVPTATSVVSMFQTNSVAFRAERTINWARRRTSSVAYLTGVAWGAPVEP